MKTILQVNTTMNIGGIETFLLNVSRNISKEKYRFIFLCYKNVPFDLENQIKELGFEFIKISDPTKISKLRHIKEIIDVLKNNKIDIIHIHTYFDAAYVTLAARICKINKIIVHAHTSIGANPKNFLKKVKQYFLKKIICLNSNVRLACSKEAGESLFLKKGFIILANGIDIKRFRYNPDKRSEIRNKYGLNDNIVIGHVGRLDFAKNHKFMINVLDKIVKTNSKYKLMLVGDGVLMQDIKKLVSKYNLDENVIFIGSTSKVNDYYNAFDCFLFPSLYEGLGNSLIEAQTNGLTCIVSSTVPKESNLTKNVIFKDLKDDVNDWADTIISCYKKRSLNNFQTISNTKYNLINTVKQLEEIYK